MSILHQNISSSEIHHPFSFFFDNESARINAANLTSSDLWKFAVQKDNNSIWWLVKTNPITWIKVIQETGSSLSGPAGGALSGNYPNPSVVNNSHNHTPGVTIPAYPTTLPPNGLAGGSLSGSYPNPELKSSGVVAGTYTFATVTIGNDGRITSASSGTVPTNNSGTDCNTCLTNPVLKGNPTAPTPQYGSDNKSVATTEFVNNSTQSETLSAGTNLIINLGFQKTVYRKYIINGTLINRGTLIIEDKVDTTIESNTIHKSSYYYIPKETFKIVSSPYYIKGILEVEGQIRVL